MITVRESVSITEEMPGEQVLIRQQRMAQIGAGNFRDSTCGDCGEVTQIGMWPFACAGRGHIMYQRLAVRGSGIQKDYAPPLPINPISEPVITRDWMNADGSLRPMKPDEWEKNHVTYVEGK